MSTEKYGELDAAICAFIKRGVGHPTNSSALEAFAKPLLATNKTPFPVAWRLIDRRMQAMRRTGKLVYVRTKGGCHGQWQLAETAA